jgi:hypothetical protein
VAHLIEAISGQEMPLSFEGRAWIVVERVLLQVSRSRVQ